MSIRELLYGTKVRTETSPPLAVFYSKQVDKHPEKSTMRVGDGRGAVGGEMERGK